MDLCNDWTENFRFLSADSWSTETESERSNCFSITQLQIYKTQNVANFLEGFN